MSNPVYGARPQLLDAEPSALCAEGLSPAVVMGIILWIVRYHFSAADRLVDQSLRSLVWSSEDGLASDAHSALVIEPASKWKVDAVQQRPGVFVRRQPWELSPLGMFGSAYQNTGDTDRERFERQVMGSHTVFCVSKIAAEAEALAWEIAGQFEGFSTKVIADMDFSMFKVAQLPEPSRLEESEQHWVVPVTVGYAFNRAWYTQQASVPVSRFSTHVEE